MEKQDLLYVAAALVIIIVIAGVIKPIMSGEPLDIGLSPAPTETTPVVVEPVHTTQMIVPHTTSTHPPPTPTPAPRVTWDQNVRDIEFVNSSQYGVSFDYSLPGGTRFNDTQLDRTMVTFATISGQYSGTSNIMYMPFPYWELWYTVEPTGATMGKDQAFSTSKIEGPKYSDEKLSGASISVMEGSYSVIIPKFTLQVMDGDDPNRIVRTVTPPGGIDKELWKGFSVETDDKKTIEIPDPRPWKERFYEGERNYFFIITTQSLDSYTIELKVPQRYLGNSSAGT